MPVQTLSQIHLNVFLSSTREYENRQELLEKESYHVSKTNNGWANTAGNAVHLLANASSALRHTYIDRDAEVRACRIAGLPIQCRRVSFIEQQGGGRNDVSLIARSTALPEIADCQYFGRTNVSSMGLLFQPFPATDDSSLATHFPNFRDFQLLHSRLEIVIKCLLFTYSSNVSLLLHHITVSYGTLPE